MSESPLVLPLKQTIGLSFLSEILFMICCFSRAECVLRGLSACQTC